MAVCIFSIHVLCCSDLSVLSCVVSCCCKKNWVIAPGAWLPFWSEVQMICMWSSSYHWHPIMPCFIVSRLRSAATSTLIVPATRRQTLGDRAFPVVAAHAWNSLPSFVRDQQSLAAFRQQLKTALFRTSFGEDDNAWAASLLTRDCLVFVRWPCNVLCVIMPP